VGSSSSVNFLRFKLSSKSDVEEFRSFSVTIDWTWKRSWTGFYKLESRKSKKQCQNSRLNIHSPRANSKGAGNARISRLVSSQPPSLGNISYLWEVPRERENCAKRSWHSSSRHFCKEPIPRSFYEKTRPRHISRHKKKVKR
jgi:hypothetical protein